MYLVLYCTWYIDTECSLHFSDSQPLFMHRLFGDNIGRSLAVFAVLCVAPRSGRGWSDKSVYISRRRLVLLLNDRKRRLQCRFRSVADQIFGDPERHSQSGGCGWKRKDAGGIGVTERRYSTTVEVGGNGAGLWWIDVSDDSVEVLSRALCLLVFITLPPSATQSRDKTWELDRVLPGTVLFVSCILWRALWFSCRRLQKK